MPYCDAFPSARAGWLDKLDEDMKAPDVLNYHPPPAHLFRPVTFPELHSEKVESELSKSDTREE